MTLSNLDCFLIQIKAKMDTRKMKNSVIITTKQQESLHFSYNKMGYFDRLVYLWLSGHDEIITNPWSVYFTTHWRAHIGHILNLFWAMKPNSGMGFIVGYLLCKLLLKRYGAKKVNVMCILLDWNLWWVVFQRFQNLLPTPLKEKFIISHFMLMAPKKNLNSMILFGKIFDNLFVQTKLDSVKHIIRFWVIWEVLNSTWH